MRSLLGNSLTGVTRELAVATRPVDTPLVFLHGMKGSHLTSLNGQRSWLTLSGLFDWPPLSDDDDRRSLSLPLTYSGTVQDRDNLVPDGLVKSVVELNTGIFGSVLDLFPFYGHIASVISTLDDLHNSGIGGRPASVFVYDWRRNLQEVSEQFHQYCCERYPGQPVQVLSHSLGGLVSFAAMRAHPHKYRPGGVMVGVPFGTGIQYLQDVNTGYFSETQRCRQFLPDAQCTFSSHWVFFPPPDRVESSFVDVSNVRFSDTGRNGFRFVPSHPSLGGEQDPVCAPYDADSIIQYGGKPITIDFYDVTDWERHQLGIFGMKDRMGNTTVNNENIGSTRNGKQTTVSEDPFDEYRQHMRTQLDLAAQFRQTVLRKQEIGDDIPPLVVCASNTIPTVNQILRRRRKRTQECIMNKNRDGSRTDRYDCGYEYDYVSGRRVPGDGRLYFTGSFPPCDHVPVQIQAPHAKQFLLENAGGDLETILRLVEEQALS